MRACPSYGGRPASSGSHNFHGPGELSRSVAQNYSPKGARQHISAALQLPVVQPINPWCDRSPCNGPDGRPRNRMSRRMPHTGSLTFCGPKHRAGIRLPEKQPHRRTRPTFQWRHTARRQPRRAGRHRTPRRIPSRPVSCEAALPVRCRLDRRVEGTGRCA